MIEFLIYFLFSLRRFFCSVLANTSRIYQQTLAERRSDLCPNNIPHDFDNAPCLFFHMRLLLHSFYQGLARYQGHVRWPYVGHQ